MASSSSTPPRTWRYRVFASFHGPDVRKTFLSHLRKEFNSNGITMFDDQGIERSQTISSSLTKAIKESRISIVILSKNYASSSWCLDELVEILKCKEFKGQIVMTVFYGVDPSDVRKQTGEFGDAYNETCARKTEEERLRWSQALTHAANIAGEDFQNWENEAKMIEKVAKDLSNKLNNTPSRDFDGMVGLQAHLWKMQSLLDLDYDGVKMVAITGPAGIGKSTIARALHSLLSNRFQLSGFVDNLKRSYRIGLDEYGSKLRLQEHFLSNILSQDGMKIGHLGVIHERLFDMKVLIILDDVNDVNQLEALASEHTWFGPGSRIIVTTKNKEILLQHGMKNIYNVGFPLDEEALEILCRYAFKQSSPHNGFEKLAKTVTWLCGNLPLGLRLVGSSLHGKNEDEWENVIHRLEYNLDRDIEVVLKVGYESLDENDQTLFLHIAVFFNYTGGGLVKNMFADSDLDVKHGLKILENRSLIELHYEQIVMHKLLEQVGKKAIRQQKPWKRQILMDARVICDVLKHATGTMNVLGISFDISDTDEVSISERAFERMANLRFLKVYKSKEDGNGALHLPEEMEFPCRLRLLDWDAYPSKCLPPTFNLQFLVELNLKHSKLEYLWQGAQQLKNLKMVNLSYSRLLKELPDLSNATNLEKLELNFCSSLVEIPSSFSHLHKLEELCMKGCINLQVIPAHMNLASLRSVYMQKCSKLRNFHVMSMEIRRLDISDTAVEDLPASIMRCSYLSCLTITFGGKGITHLPTSVTKLDLSNCDIENIPDCIKDLYGLKQLYLTGCRRLASLPELPRSVWCLYADDCESLEILSCPLNHVTNATLSFINCFRLGQQARKTLIQQTRLVLLPAREELAEFDHRAKGNSLTIRLDGFSRFSNFTRSSICVVISPNQQISRYGISQLLCRRIRKGHLDPVDHVFYLNFLYKCQTEHMYVFPLPYRPEEEEFIEMCGEIVFEFSSKSNDFDIIECSAKIFADEKVEESSESESDQSFEDEDGDLYDESYEFEPCKAFEDDTEGINEESGLDQEFEDGYVTDDGIIYGIADGLSYEPRHLPSIRRTRSF